MLHVPLIIGGDLISREVPAVIVTYAHAQLGHTKSKGGVSQS